MPLKDKTALQQRGMRVVGIEGKATSRIGPRYLAGLRALADAEPLHQRR